MGRSGDRVHSLAPGAGSLDGSSRTRRREKSLGNASDEATASFIRKVLCSHQLNMTSGEQQEPSPIEELLPPLTSSNEVDLQLYAFISILIKEYLYVWYTRISPDHVFVSEVVQIIAHCTRALEERARRIDFESLIFDDISELLDAHVNAYRISARAALSAEPHSTAREVYHTLRPHPGLKPISSPLKQDKVWSEDMGVNAAYRQMLSQALLAVLLPTEDLQNPCLRALVSEVAADLIIGNFVGRRICEANFIYESTAKACSVVQDRFELRIWAIDREKLQPPQNRLDKFGLLSRDEQVSTIENHPSGLLGLLGIITQYITLALITFRSAVKLLASPRSPPPRRSGHASIANLTLSQLDTPIVSSSTEGFSPVTNGHKTVTTHAKPFLQYKVWRTASRLSCLSRKMPWLSAFLALVQHYLVFGSLQLGVTNSYLDRLIAYHVTSPLLPLSKHFSSILLNLRVALFPGNTLPPALTQDASLSATGSAKSRRAAAFAILNLIPESLARNYFGVSSLSSCAQSQQNSTSTESSPKPSLSPKEAEVELMAKGVEELLDVFSDDYMNRHLAYAVMERILVALVPELAEDKTVADLLADRGIGIGIDTSAGLGIETNVQGEPWEAL